MLLTPLPLAALLHLLSAVTGAVQLSSQRRTDCGPCKVALCAPLPAGGCALGSPVRDPCGCCDVCAAGEGEPCGMSSRCAAGLECVTKDKATKKRRGKDGLCVCKSRSEVCGSDGVTYSNACQLRAASLKAQKLGDSAIQPTRKGACSRAPVIATPPENIWNITGVQVYLSCEVVGFPTPILTWNKIKRTPTGVQKTELLPGDRENLAIQTRGGPEKHEVTGWVLISPLTLEDAGEYECHASNLKGVAAASATITVVQSVNELSVKKEQGEEL